MNQKCEIEFPDRLVTLSDGRPGLRGGMHIDIREPAAADALPSPGGPQNAERSSLAGHHTGGGVGNALGQGEGGTSPTLDLGLRTQDSSRSVLEFVASDETLDRYDEIVTPSGWKLESYRRNPVFQNAHKYGDVIFTLGKALITELRIINGRQALCQTVEFAVDVNPMAKIAYGLYRGKFLNAVSVGFIPVRWENGSAEAGYRRKYVEQELLEVSAVGIPANPNALALGLKAGAIEKFDLKDTLDLLRGFCDSEFKVQGSDPQPSAVNHQQLLSIARDLHALLRRC